MMDKYQEDPLLDEKLAEITDQILSQAAAEPAVPLAGEEEILRMQQALVQLKQAGLDDRPDEKFASHLRAVLQKEWLRSGPKPAPARLSLFQQVKTTFGKVFTESRGRSFAFGMAAVMLLVLLLVTLLLPETTPLIGAAGGQAGLRPVEFGMGLLCLGLLVWLLMKKNR